MSRFSSAVNDAFQRLGGPGAVTWWAFGVSTVDRLLTVSVQPVNAPAPASARIAATLLAQLAMFAPLVLLRYTWLKDPLKPRPWVALAGFAFADVLRALVVDQLLHRLGGLPLMPELRVFSGFLPTLIPLVVTAYVVNTLRERSRELTALQEARAQLERSRAKAESAVEQRNEDLVQRVRSVMDAELAALSAEQPVSVVAQLQRTATDVVRPLSHELATSFAEREGPPPLGVPPKPGLQQLVGEPFVEKPLRPGLTVALISGVWISAIAVFAPARLALLTTLVLIPTLLAGANVLLRRVLTNLSSVARIGAVFGACLATGLVIGFTLWALAGSWPSAEAIAFAATFYVVVVSFGMAVVSAVIAARSALLADTGLAVERLRQQVLHTRQLQWYHQRALARALHGPVQSAVTAAALRMADASRDGEMTPELVDIVRDDLVRVLDVLHSPQSDVSTLDGSLARIVGMWDGVCDITTSIDESAAEAVERDPVVRACVTDVVTDAVSNAVRHGNAKSIAINVTQDDNLIVVTVTDDGQSTSEPKGGGLGSALLDECARAWSLTSTGSGHILTAQLPSLSTRDETWAI